MLDETLLEKYEKQDVAKEMLICLRKIAQEAMVKGMGLVSIGD